MTINPAPEEGFTDDIPRQVKAGLAGPVARLYPHLGCAR